MMPSADTKMSQSGLPGLDCREIIYAFSHFSLKH